MASQDFDIESQNTSSSGGEGNPRQWVGTTMSPTKAMQWEQLIGTKPVMPRGPYNPHGMLAAQRYVAEKYACEELLKNKDCVVVDVGAAPHRTFEHLDGRGRYMMPQVHLGDRTRRGRIPEGAQAHVCAHRFEECTCYYDQKRVYLFTHSAYYLDPMFLYRTLLDFNVEDALAVEHVFDDAFGGFYGEANWSIAKDVVTMTVSGNAGAYIHRLPPWQGGWVGPEGEAIECEVLFSLDGVTRVVRLTPVRRTDYLQEKALTWDEVQTDVHKSGPVQFSDATRNAVADNARFTHVTFDVYRIRKFGPVLYTDFQFLHGETVGLTIPVNGVSQVAAMCVNRPRTPELLAEVTHNLRNRWTRSRVPPNLVAQVLAATVALGFVVNLQVEMDTQFTMQSRFSWRMKAHSTLLQFGKLAIWSAGSLILISGVFVAMYIVVETYDKDQTSQVIIGVVFPIVLCCCCLSVCNGIRFAESWREYLERGWVRSYADDENPRAPLLGQGFTITRGLPLPGSRHVRPDEEEITGSLHLGATREREFEPNRMLVSGILADGAVPNALHTTQEAEQSAVTNRVLKKRRNPEDGALSKYARAFLAKEFKRVNGSVDTSFEQFQRWLTKLRRTYSKQYVEDLVEVWKHFQGQQIPPVPTRAFLKIEKSSSTVRTDAAKAVKPRLIQPPEDVDKVMTGPVISQIYEHVRTAWDGVHSRIMYCSGYTLRAVGAVVDTYLERHPNAIGVSGDMATYDATLGFKLQLPVFEYYKTLGMPEWMVSWLTRVRSRGVTPNGVHYAPKRTEAYSERERRDNAVLFYRRHDLRVHKVYTIVDTDGSKQYALDVEDLQMTSGRMDTNLTDSVALAMTFVELLESDVDFLLLVCGDDSFLLLPEDQGHWVKKIHDFQVSLGLNPEEKASQRRCDWEFCSKLFWYARLEDGRDVTVLGSKPFRGIARMGTNTTLPGAANAAASALSVRVDSGHVPFLGPFADRTYELCRDGLIRPTGKVDWTAMAGDQRYRCSPLNYILTQERYGLGQESEMEFILRLHALHSVPIVLGWGPLEDAVAVDEA